MPFYEQLDDHRFRSQEATIGPWSPEHQHAGPPSALLGGRLEEALGVADGAGRVTRVAIEVLRPIPVADLTVEVEVVRPGRRVALAQGVLSDDDGPLLLARAWRLRTGDVDIAATPPDAPAPATPQQARRVMLFEQPWEVGYLHSMEVREAAGTAAGHGDAFVWMRQLVPLLDERAPTPLERVLTVADSGNGVSARFDPADVLYVNTDLTVHLHSDVTDEWVGLDAATRFGADGVGLASTAIHGTAGPVGRGAQSLLVERR